MPKLSRRQQQILDYIKDEVKMKGYPPSVREIGESVGLASSSTVHGHLARLENKGYIRRDPTKPRAIEVLELEEENVSISESQAVYVPVLGKVTAGEPITAVENIDEYIPLPDRMVSDEKVFVLTIEGDSMIEAGIYDGDLVIVKQEQTADNGDIIVAMTEELEATVKRFYKEDHYIRLQPENAAMDPIILDNCTILGKVTGVFRTLH
ncbi:transcriptional repressor LexA [Salibacterium sp. K-3]